MTVLRREEHRLTRGRVGVRYTYGLTIPLQIVNALGLEKGDFFTFKIVGLCPARIEITKKV